MKLLSEITVNQIHRWGPCSAGAGEPYSRENLKRMFGGKSITPLAVCNLDIPAEDRLWVLIRSEIFTNNELRLLGADFAESVLPIFEKAYPNDTRPKDLIEGIRLFVRGEISAQDLAVLRDAARVASRVASGAAAWASGAAAWAAAWASGAAAWAAKDAARAATWASGAAAGHAAWAAWAAEETIQINFVRALLKTRQ